MKKRLIGSLEVSLAGLGCNNFGRVIGQGETTSVVHAALELGIDFFDTADKYGHGDQPFSGAGRSEEFLAEALGRERDNVKIATKFGLPMGDEPAMRGGNPAWVRRACEGSLRRLRTDHIDLYVMHYPDPGTPIGDTLGALDGLIREGKVLEIGCSNFTAIQIAEAAAVARDNGYRPFVAVENEYSLLRREAEVDVLPMCVSEGVSFLPYFPLASGLLTGKYHNGPVSDAHSRLATWVPRDHFQLTDDLVEELERLSRFAHESGWTLPELALSWLAAKPINSSVIFGATNENQLFSNVASITMELSEAQTAALGSMN